MKKIVAIVVAVIFALGMASMAFAGYEKCDKCHKGEKSIDAHIKAKDIKTGDDMVKAVRTSPKAALHKNLTDDDLRAIVAK